MPSCPNAWCEPAPCTEEEPCGLAGCPNEWCEPLEDEDCECNNCSDCGFEGGKFGFGRLRGTGNDKPEVGDALQILRNLVGLSSVLDDSNPDLEHVINAGNITRPEEDIDKLQVGDALQVLRFLVNLSTLNNWGDRYRN
jgi:hypothetical protein